MALWSGQSFPTSVSLGTFPDASQVAIDETTRTVGVQSDAGPLFRVRLVGASRSWDVWSEGPAGSMGQFAHDVEIPAGVSGHDDLFVSSGVLVDAIQSNTSLDLLVKSSGIGLKNAGLVATSLNRTEGRPTP